jgi:hypothetical protein
MSMLDIFRVNKIKADLELTSKERDALKTTLSQTEHMDFHALQQAIVELQQVKERLLQDTGELETAFVAKQQALEAALAKQRQDGERRLLEDRQQLELQKKQLIEETESKKKEIVVLDEELLLQSFGLYTPRYALQNSEEYKAKLERVRDEQEQMVKAGTAAVCPNNWTVNNSVVEGRKMVRDFTKLILRAFNNECDASITGVKFNTVETTEKKIRRAFDVLNKLGKTMYIYITDKYLELKLQELYLCHEYQLKKQEEKEEQKRLREQMREEAKVLKELEEARAKLEKEELHFAKAMQALQARLQTVTTDAQREALELEKLKIAQRLEEVERNKQMIENREHNTRAGYVYVISNLGAFGENVYKIGVTRRLEPQERIDELGDASVPFNFDTHALIFSDDAPALEYALHRAFEHRRLNLINRRREFFRVTLQEIEQVVQMHFGKPVEFTQLPDAEQYRQSVALAAQRQAAA